MLDYPGGCRPGFWLVQRVYVSQLLQCRTVRHSESLRGLRCTLQGCRGRGKARALLGPLAVRTYRTGTKALPTMAMASFAPKPCGWADESESFVGSKPCGRADGNEGFVGSKPCGRADSSEGFVGSKPSWRADRSKGFFGSKPCGRADSSEGFVVSKPSWRADRNEGFVVSKPCERADRPWGRG